MPVLLVVDDETNVLYSLERGLGSDSLRVLTARTARQGIDAVRQERPDAVILDVRLGDMSGLDAFACMREIDPRLPVVIITAYATTDTAIEAMRRGAFEYLLKPLDLGSLRQVVGRALDQSRQAHVPAVLSPEAEEGDAERIVGRSATMQDVYKAVGRVAAQDVTVLILGESGTGKELVARALYHYSHRSSKPYLALNCAALPENLLESELFGHERGAFTGADRQRIGRFEQVDGGTLLLDEIGDMSPATQAKVLRLLQEQQFERLGGTKTIKTDVRVLAATNQDLDALVAAGRFRQDLLYRLKGFTIRLPPLRERLDDLPLLVEQFIKQFNLVLGKRVQTVAPETLRLLEAHPWPGNVRELQSVVKYALIHAQGDRLTPDHLPESYRAAVPSGGSATTSGLAVRPHDIADYVATLLRAGESDIYRRVCEETDRIVLEAVLRYVKGNQVQASQLLGIARSTLRTKLRSLGLALEKHLLSDGDGID